MGGDGNDQRSLVTDRVVEGVGKASEQRAADATAIELRHSMWRLGNPRQSLVDICEIARAEAGYLAFEPGDMVQVLRLGLRQEANFHLSRARAFCRTSSANTAVTPPAS